MNSLIQTSSSLSARIKRAVSVLPFGLAVQARLGPGRLAYPLRNKLPLSLRTRQLLSARTLTILKVLLVLLPLGAALALPTGEAIAFTQTAVTWFHSWGVKDVAAWGHLDMSSIVVKKIKSWGIFSWGNIGLWCFWRAWAQAWQSTYSPASAYGLRG